MTPFQRHVQRWKSCRDCPLCDQRSQVVLARGTVPCDVLFVGEAPGVSEDALGQPFVGPAGKLLDAIVASALTGPQQQTVRVAFTNLVACYPREAKTLGNNQPEAEEIKACQGRLREFVELANPRLIVCVGVLTRDWLDPKRRGSLDLGLPSIDVDHPAFILRSPEVAQSMLIKRAALKIRNAVKEHLPCE